MHIHLHTYIYTLTYTHIHVYTTYMHVYTTYMHVHKMFAQCMHSNLMQPHHWVPPTSIILYDNASTHMCTYVLCVLPTYTHSMYVYTQYVHTHTHTYIHTYIHTHIHTHAHTYTHTHNTQRPAQKPLTLNCFKGFQIMHTHNIWSP